MQETKTTDPVEHNFNRLSKRLEYVLLFAPDFGISNHQRKIGKKLVVRFKAYERDNNSEEDFGVLTQIAIGFMRKHLGEEADAPMSQLMLKVT